MEEGNIIGAIIAFIAAFVVYGSAAAHHSVNKLQVEIERTSNSFLSRCFVWVTGRPICFAVFLRISQFTCTVVYLVCMLNITQSYLFLILFIFIYVIVAWGISGVLFRLSPFVSLKLISPVLWIPYTLLYPLSLLLATIISPGGKKGGEQYSDEVVEESLSDLCDNYDPSPDCSTEVKMVQNVMELRKSKVRDCMLPRNEIIQTGVDTTVEEILNIFNRTGLSKILVYENEMGNIKGYVHAYDLLKDPAPKLVSQIIRPIYSVQESNSASVVLKDMIENRKSIAVVIDEFGVVSGLITLEDLMEEIFGEIEDEFDVEEEEKRIAENIFELSARLKVPYVNERYKLKIPESDEYDTLAGYLTTAMQRIPKVGENWNVGEAEMKILKSSEVRVEKVLISLNRSSCKSE